jgi:D-threo-aldose 1-dehydrogenase
MSARQHHPLPPPPRAARRLACVRTALQQPPAEVAAAGAGAESTDEQLVPRGHRLTVSEVMFGSAFISTPDGGQAQANATVAASLRAGITAFDTAAAYGQSERVLGEALAAAGVGSESVDVLTKVRGDAGSEPRFSDGGSDRSARAARHTVAVSKETMGLKTLHTVRFHDAPDSTVVAEALADDGLLAGLRELRAQGEIDNISLGMCVSPDRNGPGDSNADLILELIRGAPDGTFNSAMLAYGWNLHNQAALPVMLECQRRGIEVHAAGVFWFNGYGVLFDPSLAPDTEEGEATLAKRSAWLALAEKHGVSLGAVALSFAALPQVIGRVVMGMKSPEEVALNLSSLAEEVPFEIWAEAKAEGLIDASVPVPSAP